jgi:hypothetical protein
MKTKYTDEQLREHSLKKAKALEQIWINIRMLDEYDRMMLTEEIERLNTKELGGGPYDHLEYVEVQYGNEVEIWEDPNTGDAYEVPIDIDRHFHIAKKLN